MSSRVILLGASGYIGQAFARELQKRGHPVAGLARKQVDYTRFDALLRFLRDARPGFVINAAGYTGKPNVDACETARAETLNGNMLLPQTIAQACDAAGVPWGHVSSGCIYSGGKVMEGGALRAEKDLMQPGLRAFAEQSRKKSAGSRRRIRRISRSAIRPAAFTAARRRSRRRPSPAWAKATSGGCAFRSTSSTARGITSAKSSDTRRCTTTSIPSPTARTSAAACIELWERSAPFGIYNVTNPGFVTMRHVVRSIERILKPHRSFEFWESDEEFYRVAARTPRSNCVLDVSKLLSAGVRIRPVEEALEDSLRNWKPET